MALHVGGGGANIPHRIANPIGRAVRHVEAQHVDAGVDELMKFLAGLGCRTDGGDDFGMSVVAAHNHPFRDARVGWAGV